MILKSAMSLILPVLICATTFVPARSIINQPPGTPALATDVDLALVLAADVSSSMDSHELSLQRDGYVKAFADADVINALFSGPKGRIAVSYTEWAGVNYHVIIVPWIVLDDLASVQAFRTALSAAPVVGSRGQTSIAGGLRFAAEQFATAGLHALRRTIDVSGDGPNNEGTSLEATRRQIVERGITINGLPIASPKKGLAFGVPERLDLKAYYKSAVIGGPGSFVIAADGIDGFADAIRRKLVVEIARRCAFPTTAPN